MSGKGSIESPGRIDTRPPSSPFFFSVMKSSETHEHLVRMVLEQGRSVAAAAEDLKLSERSASRFLAYYRDTGATSSTTTQAIATDTVTTSSTTPSSSGGGNVCWQKPRYCYRGWGVSRSSRPSLLVQQRQARRLMYPLERAAGACGLKIEVGALPGRDAAELAVPPLALALAEGSSRCIGVQTFGMIRCTRQEFFCFLSWS